MTPGVGSKLTLDMMLIVFGNHAVFAIINEETNQWGEIGEKLGVTLLRDWTEKLEVNITPSQSLD
jgi:hypothetical protein